MFEKLKDVFISDVVGSIKLKHVVDDKVPMGGVSEESLVKEMKNEEDGLMSIFHSVYKWNNEVYSGNRLAWIQCSGIPLQA